MIRSSMKRFRFLMKIYVIQVLRLQNCFRHRGNLRDLINSQCLLVKKVTKFNLTTITNFNKV